MSARQVCECGAPGRWPIPVGGGWGAACDECAAGMVANFECGQVLDDCASADDLRAWWRAAYGTEPPQVPNPHGEELPR